MQAPTEVIIPRFGKEASHHHKKGINGLAQVGYYLSTKVLGRIFLNGPSDERGWLFNLHPSITCNNHCIPSKAINTGTFQ